MTSDIAVARNRAVQNFKSEAEEFEIGAEGAVRLGEETYKEGDVVRLARKV